MATLGGAGFLGANLCGGIGAATAAAPIGPGVASRLPNSPDQTYAPPTNLTAVSDLYRRMTVPIGVAGAGFFPFVVDTGANQSVISRELVDRLGLPMGPSEPLNGVAGVQTVPTTIADLRIGGRLERRVLLSVLPAAAIGGNGMLGLDRLDGCALTLDFRGRALRIDTAPRRSGDRAGIAVEARRRSGQLTLVDATVAEIPLLAFIDSGAQNTIGNRALYARAASRVAAEHWIQLPIISVTGQTIMAEIANLPQLRIGGFDIPSWPVAFADLHTFQMWNMIKQPAILIGVDVLSRFEFVCLDFARDEVRFQPPGREG